MSDYTNGGEIGSGAFGVVYKLTNKRTGQISALKVLKFPISTSEMALIRREIDLLTSLKHPNIVKIETAGIINSTNPYNIPRFEGNKIAVMLEFCPTDLLKALERRTSIVDSWNRKIFREIINGVAFLHDHNVIHRDLKPANILLSTNGTVRITDFGLAKGGVFSLDARHSAGCGTPLYMPPEVRAGKAYNKSVDTYSLGVILLELYMDQEKFKKWWRSLDGDKIEYNTSLTEPHELPETFAYFVFNRMTQSPEKRPKLEELKAYFK